MSTLYWWSDYGKFSPGEGILPHTGEVIACYRQRRGFRTHAELAIAAGVLPRSVTEWETKAMLRDPDRRVFLAKLLKIPPALLGLDWRLVVYEDNTGTHDKPSEYAQEIWLADSYYHYEDTLTMAHVAAQSGRRADMLDRFERRLAKLEKQVKDITGLDREPWLHLLCRYYQAASAFTQHRGTDQIVKQKALHQSRMAVQIATEIEDNGLLATALYRQADTYRCYSEHKLARDTALRAMSYIEDTRPLTRGNIYLIAADASSHLVSCDATEARRWQDRAAHIVYRENIEPDGSFLRLNSAAVHHERAKILSRFAQMQPNQKSLLKDARSEMKMAWDAMTPDLFEWQMYFCITEAGLYMAERDLEGSARLGLDALLAARTVHSQKGESQVREHYLKLKQLDERNPYVCNLGVQLGLF